MRRLLAIVAASIAIMAASMVSNPASAAVNDGRAPAIPGEAGIMQSVKHVCENFGATVWGYRAGHCVDVDVFVNSVGQTGIRAQGQTFCQRASDGVVVQCAGAFQNISVRRLDNPDNEFKGVANACGRFTSPWHNPACPSGRFQKVTPGLLAFCKKVYEVEIYSQVALPESGSEQTSFFLTTTYPYPTYDQCE